MRICVLYRRWPNPLGISEYVRSQRHLRSRSQLDFHGSLVYTEGVVLCASSAESTKLENLIFKCNNLAINAHVCDVTVL